LYIHHLYFRYRGLLLGLFGLLAHCIDNFYIICTQARLKRPSKGSKNWGYLANKVWKRQMSKRSHFVLHPAFFRRPWSDRHYSVLHFPQWNKLPQKIQKNIPYACHHDLHLIRNHSWILTIHKARRFLKSYLKKRFWLQKVGKKYTNPRL
jgi:hypothetical protein